MVRPCRGTAHQNCPEGLWITKGMWTCEAPVPVAHLHLLENTQETLISDVSRPLLESRRSGDRSSVVECLPNASLACCHSAGLSSDQFQVTSTGRVWISGGRLFACILLLLSFISLTEAGVVREPLRVSVSSHVSSFPDSFGLRGGPRIEDMDSLEASAWNGAVRSRKLPSGGGQPECNPEIRFPPPDDGWAFVGGIPRSNLYTYDGGSSSDGGFFVVGQQSGDTPYFVVLYFDSFVNLVWGKKILAGGSVAANLLLQVNAVVSGNTVTVTCFTNYDTRAGGDVLVAQVDVHGDLLWSTVFGSAGDDFGLTVSQTHDGGYAVGGAAELFSGSSIGGFVAKLTSSGVLQWVTSVSLGAVSSVLEMPDGTLLAAGSDSLSIFNSETNWRVYLARVNGTSGSLLWESAYSTTASYSSTDVKIGDTTPSIALSLTGLLAISYVLQNYDGVYVGVGVSFVDTSTGNVTSALSLPSTSIDVLYDMVWAPDDSLLIIGFTSTYGVGGSKDILLIRATSSGDITYAVALGGALVDVGYSLLPTPDGGLYIFGYTSTFGAGVINPLIVYLNDYTTVPKAVGVLTVTDLTSVWIPSPVSMIQAVIDITASSRSESLTGPNLVIQSGIGAPGDLSGFVCTWLTYPLLSQSFPFVTSALVQFPWSYTLPSTVYQHLGSMPLAFTLSTDADFVSLVPNTSTLVGTPILAHVGTYTVNVSASANIPYIGLTVLPTISITLCVEATTPFSFFVVGDERVQEGLSTSVTCFTIASNGQLFGAGALSVPKTGSSCAVVGAYSAGFASVLWFLGVINPLMCFSRTDVQSSIVAVVEGENFNCLYAGSSTAYSVGGSVDFLVAKVNSTGSLLWSITLGGPGSDEATSIVYTPDGNTIVAGYTDSFSAGGWDVAVFGLDSDGTALWNFTYGSTGDEQLLSLVVLPSGSVLGVGYSTDSLGAGGQDCFILQFTSAGSVTSALLFGSAGDDVINSVAVTGSDGIMFTGYSTSSSVGDSDVLIGSLSANGVSVEFASTYGGAGADVGTSICALVNGGVAVTGYTSSVGAGGKDMLISAYDTSARDGVLWSKALGGPADDAGLQISQVSPTSYLYVLGTTNSFGSNLAAVMTTSPTGDLSPNFAGQTIPSGLTYTLWGPTPVVNVTTSMVGSVISGAAQSFYNPLMSGADIVAATGLLKTVVQYFDVSLLPPTVTQIPFAKLFNISLYPCISPGAVFQSVSSVGLKALPSWLRFNQLTGELSGVPTGTVRGLYFLELTAVVLNQQSISFALNVTNTVPFYDGPTVLDTDVGNFAFSLRDYVFDAEGDAVSNYQLAPYILPGTGTAVQPNPIATVNAFTGQLQGVALSGSGGAYIYNVTMSDSFGGVGWKTITLVVREPSEVAAVIEKLLPELLAAGILLGVLFALWRRDQMVNNAAQWLQNLAVLYCRHEELIGRNLAKELVEARRAMLDTLLTTIDRADFDPVTARSSVEQFCDRLTMFAVQDQSTLISAEVTRTVGVHKLIAKLAKLVHHRLEMGPPQEFINERPSEPKVAFHMKTLFLLNCMNHVAEAMLLSFGAQLTSVTLKQRITFLGSLINLVAVPVRFCFSGCAQRASSTGDAEFAMPHSTRQGMVNDAASIQGLTNGSRFGSLGALVCGSRGRTLLELQLRFAASRLHQSILYLPDSASGLDLLFDSLTHILDPGSLLKDLTSLIEMPSHWYNLYISTRLSLQALLDSHDRTARLASVQRALYLRCFQPRACGRGLDVCVSWKLLFGCVNLFTEMLIAEPSQLSQEDRAQLRGDVCAGEMGGFDESPMLTLRLLAALPQTSSVGQNEAMLIRRAAVDALDLTSPTEVIDNATAALCLWTLRPSTHVRIQHDEHVSGSTLLPAVSKKSQLTPLLHRPSPRVSPVMRRNATGVGRLGGVRSRRIEEVPMITYLDAAPLNEPVVPFADTPVKYWPSFRMYDPWEGTNGSTITLRHLASHMAGFGRITPASINTTEQALEVFASVGGMAQPAGFTPQYSNPGFATLGYALATAANTTYSAAVSDLVTRLGLGSGLGIEYTEDVLARLATGYISYFKIPVPFQNLTYDAPAGFMYGNAANLSAMLQLLSDAANGEFSPGGLGLSPTLARDMLKPVWISADGTFQQGTPWEMFKTSPAASSYLVRGKDGGMPGFTSYVAVIPELRFSVALLWNGDDLDLDGIINSTMETLVPPLVSALQAVQSTPYPGPNPPSYFGDYVSTDILSSGSISFQASTGLVFLAPLNNFTFIMSAVPDRPDTFFMYLPPGNPGQSCSDLFGGGPNSYVLFTRSPQGNVTSFTIPYLYDHVWTKV